MTTDYFVTGGLYRLIKNYYWIGDDVDWDDATEEQLLAKPAKAGDILVFVGFKSCVSWGKEFKALSFVSVKQGGLVYVALGQNFWEYIFERIPGDDEKQGGTIENSVDEQ